MVIKNIYKKRIIDSFTIQAAISKFESIYNCRLKDVLGDFTKLERRGLLRHGRVPNRITDTDEIKELLYKF